MTKEGVDGEHRLLQSQLPERAWPQQQHDVGIVTLLQLMIAREMAEQRILSALTLTPPPPPQEKLAEMNMLLVSKSRPTLKAPAVNSERQ